MDRKLREGKERSNLKNVKSERPNMNPPAQSKKSEIKKLKIENGELKKEIEKLESVLETYLYKN